MLASNKLLEGKRATFTAERRSLRNWCVEGTRNGKAASRASVKYEMRGVASLMRFLTTGPTQAAGEKGQAKNNASRITAKRS